MSLKEAHQILSADINRLYETYTLISSNKHQFNDLDVALLQQQLLHVYHSLLKIQAQLSPLPVNNNQIEEILPMAGLKPEPEANLTDNNLKPVPETIKETAAPVVEPTVEPEPIKEAEVSAIEVPIVETVELQIEEPIRQAPHTLTLELEAPPVITDNETTLDDLEAMLQDKELGEAVKVSQMIQQEIPTEKTQDAPTEMSVHEKLSANLKTSDLYDKISKSQQQSLKQSITLNKKIAFVNQLFNENTVEYAKSIEKLNASGSLHEALRYFNELKHQYNWSNEHVLVKELEQLVEKRFS